MHLPIKPLQIKITLVSLSSFVCQKKQTEVGSAGNKLCLPDIRAQSKLYLGAWSAFAVLRKWFPISEYVASGLAHNIDQK